MTRARKPMPPRSKRHTDLFKNILDFSQALRERKVRVTTDNVLDALRGMSFISIERRDDFYQLLKTNFVSQREESAVFDELFECFWSIDDQTRSAEESSEKDSKPSHEGEEVEEGRASLLKEWAEKNNEDRGIEEREVTGYSPEETLARKDFGSLGPEELEGMREFVSALSRRMALAISRRWKRGKSGDRIDFRRSFRQSLKYGGDLVELNVREPKPRPLQLILVCDVSGSMDIYSQFSLLLMYGLQNHYPRCETFVYSTRLSHISSLLKRKPFAHTLRLLSEKVEDWSGGTDIGGALHHLHQRYSEFFISRRTVFLMFSDGWDRGDTQLLNVEMKHLKRQVKRLIWLNPLLGSRSYQPLCKGMATALPYLDHFLPCHNLAALKNLGRLISKI